MAADRTIRVKVEAQNLRETTAEAQKLNSELDRAERSRKAGSRTGSRAADTALFSSESDVGLRRGTAASGGRGDSRDFARQAQGLGGLVHVYATFAANIFAVSAAFQALSKAMDFKRMEAGMRALEASTGRGLSTIAKNMRDVTEGAISMTESIRFTNLTTAAGFSTKQIEGLTRAARGASSALGRDLADAMDRLVRGTAKLEPELLDELGLLTRTQKAGEAYAKSIGKTFEQLTQFEKTQAFVNAVIDEAEVKYGAIADAVDPNPYTKFIASLDNAGKKLLETVNTVVAPLVSVFAETPALMAGGILTLVTVLLNKAIPSMSSWAESSAAAASKAAAAQEAFGQKAIAAQKGVVTARRAALKQEYEAVKENYKRQIKLSVDHANNLKQAAKMGLSGSSSFGRAVQGASLDTLASDEFSAQASKSIAAARKKNASVMLDFQKKIEAAEAAGNAAEVARLQTAKAAVETRTQGLLILEKEIKLLRASRTLDTANKAAINDKINAIRRGVTLRQQENTTLRETFLREQALLKLTTARKTAQANISAAVEVGTLSHVVETVKASFADFNRELVDAPGLSAFSKRMQRLKFIGATTFTTLTTGAAVLGKTLLNAFFFLGTITTVFQLVTEATGAFSKESEQLATAQDGLGELLEANEEKLRSLDKVTRNSADNASTFSKRLELLANISEDLAASFDKTTEAFRKWSSIDPSFFESTLDWFKGFADASAIQEQVNGISGAFQNLQRVSSDTQAQKNLEQLASILSRELGTRVNATASSIELAFIALKQQSAGTVLAVSDALAIMQENQSKAARVVKGNFDEATQAARGLVEGLDDLVKLDFKDKGIETLYKSLKALGSSGTTDIRAFLEVANVTDQALEALAKKGPEAARAATLIKTARDDIRDLGVGNYAETQAFLANSQVSVIAAIEKEKQNLTAVYQSLESNFNNLQTVTTQKEFDDLNKQRVKLTSEAARLTSGILNALSSTTEEDIPGKFKNSLVQAITSALAELNNVQVKVNAQVANVQDFKAQGNSVTAETFRNFGKDVNFSTGGFRGVSNALQGGGVPNIDAIVQEGIVKTFREGGEALARTGTQFSEQAKKALDAQKAYLDALVKAASLQEGLAASRLKEFETTTNLLSVYDATNASSAERFENEARSLELQSKRLSSDLVQARIKSAQAEKTKELFELSKQENISAKTRKILEENILITYSNKVGEAFKEAEAQRRVTDEKIKQRRLDSQVSAIEYNVDLAKSQLDAVERQGTFSKENLAISRRHLDILSATQRFDVRIANEKDEATKANLILEKQRTLALLQQGLLGDEALAAERDRAVAVRESEALLQRQSKIVGDTYLTQAAVKALRDDSVESYKKEMELIKDIEDATAKRLAQESAIAKYREAQLQITVKETEALLKQVEAGKFTGTVSQAGDALQSNIQARAQLSRGEGGFATLSQGIVTSMDKVSVSLAEMIQKNEFNTQTLLDGFRNSLSDVFRDAAANIFKNLWRDLLGDPAEIARTTREMADTTNLAIIAQAQVAMAAKSGTDLSPLSKTVNNSTEKSTDTLVGTITDTSSKIWEGLETGFGDMIDSFSAGMKYLGSILSFSGGGAGGSTESGIFGTLFKAGMGYLTGGWAGAAMGAAGSLGGYDQVGTTSASANYSADPSWFAKGGIMSEYGPLQVQKYSNGGIATSPQLAVFGEGRQNEAYVPLPDGRSIPVSMEGGTGGTITNNFGGIEVNVNVEGGSGSADVSASGELAKQLGTQIKSVVLQELMTQSRPGGLLYSGR